MKRTMITICLMPTIVFGALSERDQKIFDQIEQHKSAERKSKPAEDGSRARGPEKGGAGATKDKGGSKTSSGKTVSNRSSHSDKPRDAAVDTVDLKSDYYMKPPFGIVRGVGTVASAVFDPLWGFAWGVVQDDSGDGNILTAAMGTGAGCFIAVWDVCMGCADIISAGWLGNEYFYNKAEWGLKPWCFERPIENHHKRH